VDGLINTEVFGLIDADLASFRRSSRNCRPQKTLVELLASWASSETFLHNSCAC